ncbi:hypothetical protein HMPREF9019_0341 [Hoylesella timonensis CRIS 5C-B1]|uniref:Uncharacterized protein n=1 Tax=Hoylesella timonensis CRIS 5C-B1 TaxID=679189 RepID=D1VX07_9BACT|nr:hypothetical protein HMPREF9019_0341 [Hoylesella timonensis CRIS 5C-B1]
MSHFQKIGLEDLPKENYEHFGSMEAVLPTPQGCMKEIN